MAKGSGNDAVRAEKRRGRPTMTDVARIAGVSQSSVSLVLNQMTSSRISPETRDRVFEAARQVGYELPSGRRDGAVGPEPRTIAYLVDEFSNCPLPGASLDGARDCAFAQGCLVAAYVTRSNRDLEEATIAAIRRDRSVVGVIYSTAATRQVTLPQSLLRVPTVLLNCYAEPRSHISIQPGDVAGGFAATAHLTELGHRRIGFINGEESMAASADRLKGYRQALATADIAFDGRLVRHGEWLPLAGYYHTFDLMALDTPPTAIFCASDLVAMGAMEALSDLGLKVPEDVSILGYDDQSLARYTHPPLSTLVLPSYEMGHRAAQALLDVAVHGKPIRPMTIKIDGPLVRRGSTGECPPAAVLRPKRKAAG